MSISIKPFGFKERRIVEYTIIKNKKDMGTVYFCPDKKKWTIGVVSSLGAGVLTLSDIAMIWELLIGLLDLEGE